MKFCPAGDARRLAARAFIRWYRDPKALPKLFEDWETETMHSHGWSRALHPETPPARRHRYVSRHKGRC
ncbi:hypothetical protein [Streptomyces aureus]|uniref:hypothetical protein n=1 Tax=Streptomyces aureus TaxID=193461 RepID=UPI0036B2779B